MHTKLTGSHAGAWERVKSVIKDNHLKSRPEESVHGGGITRMGDIALDAGRSRSGY